MIVHANKRRNRQAKKFYYFIYIQAGKPPCKKKNEKIKILKKNKSFFNIPRQPLSVHKNVSPFGSAVWPAKGNININVLFYYIN